MYLGIERKINNVNQSTTKLILTLQFKDKNRSLGNFLDFEVPQSLETLTFCLVLRAAGERAAQAASWASNLDAVPQQASLICLSACATR